MVRDSRKIAAILAADVVDYSRLMGADEAATLAALAVRRALFDTLVREFDGRVFGSVGDSLMAEFPSAVHAVECAQRHPGRRRRRERRGYARRADAPAHRRQPRRRDRRAGRRGRRRGQRRRAPAGAREAGRRARSPAPSTTRCTSRSRRATSTPARAASRTSRSRCGPSRCCRPPHGVGGAHARRIPALHGAPPGARLPRSSRLSSRLRRSGFSGATSRCRRPAARSASAPAAGIRRAARLDRRAAIHQHDRRPRDRLPRRRPRRGVDPPPERRTGAARGPAPVRLRLQGQGCRRARDRRRARRELRRRRQRPAAGRRRARQRLPRRPRDRRQSLVGFVRVDRRLTCDRGQDRHAGAGRARARAQHRRRRLRRRRRASATSRPTTSTCRDSRTCGKPKSARTLDAAEQLFQRSLAEKPDFARAQAGLCQTRVERYLLERVPAHVARGRGSLRAGAGAGRHGIRSARSGR